MIMGRAARKEESRWGLGWLRSTALCLDMLIYFFVFLWWMSVCLYICVHVCIIHIYIYLHIYLSIYISIYLCMYLDR